MAERVDRRGFLGLAGSIFRHVAFGGGALAASETLAVQKIQSIHEITPEVVNRLGESVQRMSPYIKFLLPHDSEGALNDAKRFNSKPMAQAIAQLAYYEGGNDEVARVTRFISERGVEISISEEVLEVGSSHVKGGKFGPSEGPDDPAKVVLYPSVLLSAISALYKSADSIEDNSGEEGILHELQHLVQQARDPDKYNAYLVACVFATPLVLSLTTGAVIAEVLPEKILRRSLIRNSLFDLVLAMPILKTAMDLESQGKIISSLYEREAYSRGKLVDTRSFENVRGQLLSFFESKEEVNTPEEQFAKEFIDALVTADFSAVESFLAPDYARNEYTEEFLIELGKNIQGRDISRIIPRKKSDASFGLMGQKPKGDKYLRIELEKLPDRSYTSYGSIFLGLKRINDRFYITELVVRSS